MKFVGRDGKYRVQRSWLAASSKADMGLFAASGLAQPKSPSRAGFREKTAYLTSFIGCYSPQEWAQRLHSAGGGAGGCSPSSGFILV